MKDYTSIQKCNCGRSGCQFFSGAIDDRGSSYTKENLQEIIKELKEYNFEKQIEHLSNLLKEE